LLQISQPQVRGLQLIRDRSSENGHLRLLNVGCAIGSFSLEAKLPGIRELL
jgi:hypothetical protein